MASSASRSEGAAEQPVIAETVAATAARMQGQNHRSKLLPQLEDPTLYDLIVEGHWKEAWNLVERDPTAPFNARVHEGNGGRTFPLHKLCRIVQFIDFQEDPEFSDDEDVDDTEYSQQDRDKNKEIYKLSKFMIQQSQSIQTPTVDSAVSHQSILTIKDRLDRTPFHDLLYSSSDPNMIQILLDGGQSSPGLLEELQTSTDSWGATLLHLVSEGSCPFSSVRLMMQYFSGARLVPDDDGDLPLHWALSSTRFASSRRLHLLLDGCHESLMVRNNNGMLPLQEMETVHFDDWDELDETEKRALWAHLEAVLMVVASSAPVYNDSWSTMHAIASGLSFIPTKFLRIASVFDDTTTEYDSDGMIPLHLGVSKPPSKETIDMYTNSALLLTTDATVGMRTRSGRLPLHLAVESNQPGAIVSRLAEAAPQTLSVIDPVTQLIPFQLAAVEENNSLTAVYSLLRMNPSLL